MHTPELHAYVACMAEEHDLPVDELLAETEALLARARKATRGQGVSDLLGWLATESGWSLEEIRADILALENETEGLLGEILGSGPATPMKASV